MTAPRLKNVTPHSDAGQEVGQADHNDVYYPVEDGIPWAESEYQLFPLHYAHRSLTAWLSSDPTVWVGGNMFLYYEEGFPSSVVTPDVFVVTETHKRHLRNIFQTWVEGRVPELVLEVMSRTSVHRDTVEKYELYRRLGIREYWMYDPTEEGFLNPRLRGYTLVGDEYRPIEVREVDGKYVGASEVLGLELHANADWFRFFDPASGEYLLDYQENQRAQVKAETLARTERAAREQIEARAEQERAARESAEVRAEQERAAREAAEAQLAAMEAELRRLRGQQRPD